MQSSVSTLPVQDSLAIKGRGVLWRIKTELFILVLTLYLGTRGGGGGDEDLSLPVTGRVGETVTLPCTLNLTHPIDRVTWMFHVNGKKILLAEFRDQKFIRENKNYFSNRLEGSNTGTTLLIRKLRMEDSGIFTARFLVNGEEAEITYNVTVLGGGGGGDVPLPVTGRVGETVSLTPRLNLTDPIIGVTWMVDRNGKKILLAEFRDQNFINHLEETTLQIRELRMEDSGIFTAQILFKRKIIDIYYNVTVLEPLPIPTPVIEKTLDGNSTDLCHLHCSVPSNSPTLSYSWTYRDTGTDRLYANGSTITVSLKDKALGAEFTCWVQNPAHRNSTSVPLYPCGEAQTEGSNRSNRPLIIAMSLLCVIVICIIIAAFIVYKTVYYRRQIMQDKKTTKDNILYADIQHNNHDINQGMSSQNNTGNCKKNENIVYAELSTNNGMHGEV